MFPIVCALLLASSELGSCANILVMDTGMSHSHHLWNEKLVLELARRGHNLTVLSLDEKNEDHKNYHLLHVKGAYDVQHDFAIEDMPKSGHTFTSDVLFDYIAASNRFVAKSEALKNLLSYPKHYKFDLILWDFICGENLYPIVKRFGEPPVIGLSPFDLQPYIADIMGNHLHSYIPFYMRYFTPGLWQRVQNTVDVAKMMYYRGKFDRDMKKDALEMFGEAYEPKISLALINYDVNFDVAQPLTPNIVPVGGLQIVETKPLPKDLAEILDKEKRGVVYFALGTNVRPEMVDSHIFDSFVSCFAKLEYKVLWKIRNSSGLELPKNVVTRPWMPQNDILAHKNTKVFISHGGLLSTQEAIYHGVPLVIFPFFADQFSNADRYEDMGIARQLKFAEITEEHVCETLRDVLENDKYRKRAEIISQRLKSRQNKPVDTAVYWVEHVLKFGAPEYLDTAARDMGIIARFELDVLLVFVGVSLLPFVLFGVYICRKQKRKVSKKQKQG